VVSGFLLHTQIYLRTRTVSGYDCTPVLQV